MRYFEDIRWNFGVDSAYLSVDSGLVAFTGFNVFANSFFRDVLVATGAFIGIYLILHFQNTQRI